MDTRALLGIGALAILAYGVTMKSIPIAMSPSVRVSRLSSRRNRFRGGF